MSSSAFSQMAGESAFKMLKAADQRIGLNINSDKSIQLHPFTDHKKISGLTICGDIELHSDSSLVRVILIDDQLNEYLIYEAYPLLTENVSFAIDQNGEETAILDNIIPMSITIETVDASIHLKEIETRGEDFFMAKTRNNKLQQQQSEKIKRINQYIERKGLKWIAGETAISGMTYQDKQKMFGGKVPNLQGFEYYRGGIFVLPGVLEENTDAENTKAITQTKSESPYVKEFSWRNRHGQNWVTSVKYQGGCGSCWAFAVTGATELLVNLYYNQHLDLDLSEQDVLSCSGGGSCNGGSSYYSLSYIMNTGIVNESCFPYATSDLPCENKCTDPAETIRIGSKSIHSSEDEKRREIIKGATAASVGFWNHVMTLVGYKVLEEGDLINIHNNGFDGWIIIQENDILMGQTAWLFKNSWGTNWGDDGYVYVVGGISASSLHGPVYSVIYNDSDIRCTDQDGDGYYTWGTGTKPAHCPDCPDEPDGDDSDGCLGPMDEFGNITIVSSTPEPVAEDTSVVYGEKAPDLTAAGENIKWYDDEKLTHVIHTGNLFVTGHTQPGVYSYYVTQTISECESKSKNVKLTIINPVPPPMAEDVIANVCDPIPNLTAAGENLKWHNAPSNPFVDSRDAQIYKAVGIGNQRWMAENLNYYTQTGSWYYNYDSMQYAETYGRLYNWETACDACPEGWHLPTDKEWKELEIFIGMSEAEADGGFERGILEGGKLKERGTIHWCEPNNLATDNYGFKALPGGEYMDADVFQWINYSGTFWTSTAGTDHAIIRRLNKNYGSIDRVGIFKESGLSVRCLREWNGIIGTGNTITPEYSKTGTYIYYVTQTIDGIESDPDTVRLILYNTNPSPIVEDVGICYGEPVPDLVAIGKNIKWYNNADLMTVIHTGSGFTPGVIQPNTYIYYVTQTVSDCESLPDTVILKINPIPASPDIQNTYQYEANDVVYLSAIGENIRWYNDENLLSLIYSGDTLILQQSDIGVYTYYVTQTISGCESLPDTVTLNIIPLPPEAEDATAIIGQLAKLSAIGKNIRWYDDAALSNLIHSGDTFTIRPIDIGTHTYYVTQTISGFESYPDTVILTTIINPPKSEDVSICEGEMPVLTAEGENIQWYDVSLNHFIDTRDGQRYSATLINGYIWMAENLNYYTPSGSCYYNTDSISYADPYARLYNWETAKEVCPSGWRLPSDHDWKDLEVFLGMAPTELNNFGFRGTDEGGKLKSTGFDYWLYPNEGATNEYGFNALGAGDGGYLDCFALKEKASFWTSTSWGINTAILRVLSYSNAYIERGERDDASTTSVRCMREIPEPVALGSVFTPGITEPGTYNYYVTQTVNGFESPADTVVLTIHPVPDVPIAFDDAVCENQDAVVLMAEGENIKWYADLDTVSLVDERDGQEYLTVKIGNQWWMAENLNYGFMIGHTLEQTNNDIAEKYCYNDNEENCHTYGGLYQWDEVMNYVNYEVNRGVCPEGWHIPTDREWMDMERYLGMEASEALSKEWRGTNEGGKLKDESDLYWQEPNAGATNESGFSALPGGTRYLDQEFYNIGSWAYFWTSSLEQDGFAWKRNLHSIESRIRRMSADTKESMSVRCIKDDILLAEGNTYHPEISDMGNINYYVSQTVNGCESNYETVQLTIKPAPGLPVAEDQTICYGEETPDLSAQGENISWYSDTALTNCINSGNIFPATQTEPGTYTYYVTQTLEECEGDCIPVRLIIHSLPEIELGPDTTITDQQSMILGIIGDEGFSYLWNTGSDESYIEVSGNAAGVGDHTYWLLVTDSNSCENSDTVIVSVMHVNAIPYSQMNRSIQVYPNPGVDILHVHLQGIAEEKLSIEVFDRLGNVLISENHRAISGETDLKLDISVLSPGVYFVRILGEKIMLTKGIAIL